MRFFEVLVAALLVTGCATSAYAPAATSDTSVVPDARSAAQLTERTRCVLVLSFASSWSAQAVRPAPAWRESIECPKRLQ
jgi:hypothetical protein